MKIGCVTNVPTLLCHDSAPRGGPNVCLHFLTIDDHTAIRAPKRYLRRHPAQAVVAPVGGNHTGHTVGKMHCRIDLVVHVPRKDTVEHSSAYGCGHTNEIIHDIDCMARV